MRRLPVRSLLATGLLVLGSGLSVATMPAQAASSELVNRAVAAGIDLGSTPSWAVCPGDFDADGDEDFHASLHMKNPGALYRHNLDGNFTRVAYNIVSPKIPNGGVDRHDCAWADVDHNGLSDLYSSAGRWSSNRVKGTDIDNELFLQTGPDTWRDVGTVAGVGEPCSRGRHVVFAHFDGDGWVDLFVGAQNERLDSADPCNAEPNYPYNEQSKVFINRGLNASGEWTGFRLATEYNVRQGNVGLRGAVAWDYNRDGRMDLLALAAEGKTPFLFRNDGGRFTEVARAGAVRLPAVNGVEIGDVTRDGIADFVFADTAGFAYRAGTATGVSGTTVRLTTVTTTAKGWEPAVGDINGDGLTDVFGLVANRGGSSNPDDIVLVARAGGGFGRYTAPSASGDANDVAAIQVGGRHHFVVLNGGNSEKESPGPVQLIAWAG